MKQRYDAIEALRGLASVFVVVGHIGLIFFDYAAARALTVDLFFLLSGVVVAKSYEDRLTTGALSFSAFLRVRMIRLYPLIVLGALIGASSQAITGKPAGNTAALLVPELTFIPWFSTEDRYPLNGVQWSLFFELVVNLFYAAIVARLTNIRVLAVSVVSLVGLIVYWLIFGREFANVGYGTGWHFIAGFARVGFSFFAGVLIYRLRYQLPPPAVNVMWLCLAFAFCTIGVALPGPEELIIGVIVLPIICWLCLTAKIPRSLASPALLLGRLSYPLYAIHVPLLLVINHWIGTPANVADYLLFSLSVAAILGTAILADLIWDTPIRQWLLRRHVRGLASSPSQT